MYLQNISDDELELTCVCMCDGQARCAVQPCLELAGFYHITNRPSTATGYQCDVVTASRQSTELQLSAVTWSLATDLFMQSTRSCLRRCVSMSCRVHLAGDTAPMLSGPYSTACSTDARTHLHTHTHIQSTSGWHLTCIGLYTQRKISLVNVASIRRYRAVMLHFWPSV